MGGFSGAFPNRDFYDTTKDFDSMTRAFEGFIEKN